jgi:hypothetical protein
LAVASWPGDFRKRQRSRPDFRSFDGKILFFSVRVAACARAPLVALAGVTSFAADRMIAKQDAARRCRCLPGQALRQRCNFPEACKQREVISDLQ